MSDDEKATQPRCTVCKLFIPAADPHATCLDHRECSQGNPCSFDADWTPEQWQELAAKKEKREADRIAKKENRERKKRSASADPSSGSTTSSAVSTGNPLPLDFRDLIKQAIQDSLNPIKEDLGRVGQRLQKLEEMEESESESENSDGESQGRDDEDAVSIQASPLQTQIRDETGHARVRTEHDSPPHTQGARSPSAGSRSRSGSHDEIRSRENDRDRTSHRSRSRSRDLTRRESRDRSRTGRDGSRDHRGRSRDRQDSARKGRRDRPVHRRSRSREDHGDHRYRLGSHPLDRRSRSKDRSAYRYRDDEPFHHDNRHRDDEPFHHDNRHRSRSSHGRDRDRSYPEDRRHHGTHGTDRDRRYDFFQGDFSRWHDRHGYDSPSTPRAPRHDRTHRRGHSSPHYRSRSRERTSGIPSTGFQPSASTHASESWSYPPAASQQPGCSSWDAILGPHTQRPEPRTSPQQHEIHLDDIRDLSSPSFKPRYSHLPPAPPDKDLVDLAKRNLLDDFDSRKEGLDPDLKAKIRRLGDPFHLDPPGVQSDGMDQDSARDLKFLKPSVAAPFFAAVLVERDIKVTFPDDSKAKDDKLGLAGNRTNKSPLPPRPLIPLVPYFEEFCDDLVERNQPGPQRLNWVRQTFRAPQEHEDKYFTPPLVPAEAWTHMQIDQGSWSVPEKSAPAGVAGGSGAAKSERPRRIPPWNRRRDQELSGLESLARDGMRLANASLLTFSHLMNGIATDSSTMTKENKLRSLYTLKDLQYCTGEHFCRLSSQLAHLRRLNAMAALNLTDPQPFKDSRMGPDLFGGRFKELHTADVALRKARLEEEKLRKTQQKKSNPPDKGNRQSFRGHADDNKPSTSTGHTSSSSQRNRGDNQKDRFGNKGRRGGDRGGRGDNNNNNNRRGGQGHKKGRGGGGKRNNNRRK